MIPESSIRKLANYIQQLSVKYGVQAYLVMNNNKGTRGHCAWTDGPRKGEISLSWEYYGYERGFAEYHTVAWVWDRNGFVCKKGENASWWRIVECVGEKALWAFALHEYSHILKPKFNHGDVFQVCLHDLIRDNPFEQSLFYISPEQKKKQDLDDYFQSLIPGV